MGSAFRCHDTGTGNVIVVFFKEICRRNSRQSTFERESILDEQEVFDSQVLCVSKRQAVLVELVCGLAVTEVVIKLYTA